MHLPWTDRTGLAKAAAIFASLTTVCLGLCGLNWIVVLGQQSGNFIPVILFAAWIESAGLAVGVIGLIVVGVIYLIRMPNDANEIRQRIDRKRQP